MNLLKLKKFSTFSKKSNTKFSKKCEFWPEFFFAYESENYKKPKIVDFWYHFVDRPKNNNTLFHKNFDALSRKTIGYCKIPCSFEDTCKKTPGNT